MDVWSAGVVLYELLSGGHFPFYPESISIEDYEEASNDYQTMLDMCVLEQDLDLDLHCGTISQEAKGLLESMLAKDLDTRPTCEELMGNPWFSNPGGCLTPEASRHLTVTWARRQTCMILQSAYSRKLQLDHRLRCQESVRARETADIDSETFCDLASHWTPEEARANFDKADDEKKGRISFNVFVAATFTFPNAHELRHGIGRLLEELDADDDGTVELVEVESEFGQALELNSLRAAVEPLDGCDDNMVRLCELGLPLRKR